MKHLRAFLSSAVLECRALFRSGLFAAVLALQALSVAVLPYFLRSDGTEEGALSLYSGMVFGAVFSISGISAFAAACGTFHPARRTNRLSLALVHPAPPAFLYLAKCAALTVFAGALAASGGAMALARMKLDASVNPSGALPPCVHSAKPLAAMPLREEAEKSLERILASDPSTEEAKRKIENCRDNPRFLVLWALENRLRNAMESVDKGKTATFRFPAPPEGTECEFRLKCPTFYGLHAAFDAEFAAGPVTGRVVKASRQTVRARFDSVQPGPDGTVEISVRNKSGRAMLFRPRRDVALETPAGPFTANLARAALAWTGFIGFLCAFGAMFSSALSRPVAIFSATALMAAVLAAPLSSAQMPNPSDMGFGGIACLCISHFIAEAAAPLFAVSPSGCLASGIAVEWSEVFSMLALGCIAAPLALSPLAASALKAKPQE